MLRRDDSPTQGNLAGRSKTKPNSMAPAYQRPNHGIFFYLPDFLIPYAELMRLDRPAGIYLFFVPHLLGHSMQPHFHPTPYLRALS